MKQPELPDIGDKTDVAKHRLRVAKEDLQAANLLLEANSYRGANNRAYYAIFHAVSAVLAMERVAFKKHKDTLAYFNKNYVATGHFDKSLGRMLANLQQTRETSDYDDFFIASKEEAEIQCESAGNIIEAVKQYLNDKYQVEI